MQKESPLIIKCTQPEAERFPPFSASSEQAAVEGMFEKNRFCSSILGISCGGCRVLTGDGEVVTTYLGELQKKPTPRFKK
jgi:hypothetical protein